MTQYLARRGIYLLVQLLVVATVVFMLLRLVPGDPARAILGDTATEEQVARVRHQLGLDQPIYRQYVSWMADVLRGDLGTSITSGRPVATDVRDRLGNSLELIVLATALSLIIGLPLGIIAGLRANRLPDFVLSAAAMLGLSLPGFVVGTVLLLIFALRLRWLPQTQFVEWSEDPAGHFKLVILPVLTLAASTVAVIMRMTRSSMLEVVRQDYIKLARAKGLSERTVILRHALRNAINPVVSVVGLELATLLGGTVIVETIFGWPGLSSLLIAGVRARDYPVVQGVVLLIAVLTILINIAVDIAYAVLDPRIRVS
ncbi:MAG: ABC transporter permease [Sphaerobacter thermophilus]|jgi:peptide/nickel transport system permease protein|uniref:ABC transporter permease n=1 Tax=Sphaerobacter thermophilus TaxID=2057 RepID=UPI000DB30851|nr:MAG: ABC transporter permease [Sphaerobacter thermophilus]